MKFTPELRNVVLNGTKEERVYILSHSFLGFALYYFSDYFSYELAQFHKDFAEDCYNMGNGNVKEVVWVGFKECGKTSLAKIFIIWLISYGKRHFINYDSYDKSNAESALFDVVLELQTNRKLISDFGSLFNEERGDNEKKLKKITSFITVNDIKVESFSTGQSTRGRLYKNFRPDCYICHEKGTKIFFNDEWINVENHPTFKGYKKDIGYKIQLHGIPFGETVTPEHRYWIRSIKFKNGSNQKKIEVSEDGWKEAQTLKKQNCVGNYIGYPIDHKIGKPQTIEKYFPGDIKERNAKGQTIKSGGTYKKYIPKEFSDKDWWWLMGLWWGDGHLAVNDSVVGFTIANNDKLGIGNKVRKILEKYQYPFLVYPKDGCYQLQFCSTSFGRWLRTWRTGNSIKQPPFWVERLPLEYQSELIKGYIAGDGFLDYKNNSVRLTSVNLNGLLCVRRILARLDIPSSIRNGIDGQENVEIMGKICKTQKKYDLRFRKNAKLLGYEIEDQTRYGYESVFIKDGYLWNKIKTVEKDKQEKLFCPIKTEESKYITHFGLSHNCDDLENFRTITSPLITNTIIEHINELRAGLAVEASILYLGNYLTDQGVVQYIMDTVERSEGVVRFIPVIENKLPIWEAKYTLTDSEMLEWNKDKLPKKVSLESKKKELGDTVFNTEMMLNPVAAGDLLFDRQKIDKLLQTPDETILVEDEEYPKSVGGFKIWDKYKPRHRYAIGADTSLGVGRDSCTSVLMDFTTYPNKQVGSFTDNKITPDDFAHELKIEGEMFGGCLLAPENNSQGIATLNELKAIYPINKIFRPSGKGVQYQDMKVNQLGWNTNRGTKGDMMFQLKAAVEDGTLIIMDKRILREMKNYRTNDLQHLSKDPNATRHFDLLTATAIAFAMRDHAKVKVEVLTNYRDKVPNPAR